MKLILYILLNFFLIIGAIGQSPVGIYKTIDDETGEAKSHVEIFEKDGKLFGKIVKLLPAAQGTHCKECSGELKDKPLIGLVILENLEPYKDYWSYGTILDPQTGKVYKASLWREGNSAVRLRGYIGISALGRTQTWEKVK